RVQIQTTSGYTLSASGRSFVSAKVLLAKELSLIRNPDAPTQCEICGLARTRRLSLSKDIRVRDWQFVLPTAFFKHATMRQVD
ncbi:MAG TPA: hypothetical protein VGI78_17540, partial [Acetobacteraceae bacterium]